MNIYYQRCTSGSISLEDGICANFLCMCKENCWPSYMLITYSLSDNVVQGNGVLVEHMKFMVENAG